MADNLQMAKKGAEGELNQFPHLIDKMKTQCRTSPKEYLGHLLFVTETSKGIVEPTRYILTQ